MLIYNTLTRKKEVFTPIEPSKVKMYVCGPTVYNYFHIGNARPFLFFDVVRSYFHYIGYTVEYIQNITDIDDKIINRANEERTDYTKITQKYIAAFYEDLQALHIKPADKNPKATDYISEMIELINELIELGYAYESGGDVYFSVDKAKEYGKLSGKNLDELLAGKRVEKNPNKQNSFDFTLWKAAKENEPAWDSKWGRGRPGWHTECVVMSRKLLGTCFDIHGGGIDLIFPHHENELVQAESVAKQPLANIWMHNGFLNIEGEKMSKSLDNFFTARDVLKTYDADTIRFFFLSKHYRSPIDFSKDILNESKVAISRFHEVFRKFPVYMVPCATYSATEVTDVKTQFIETMNDDFNTAKAIACLFDLSKIAFNQNLSPEVNIQAANLLYEIGSVLGFFSDIALKLSERVDAKAEQLIQLLIDIRNQAKKSKYFDIADTIRDQLKNIGIELRDTPNGTEWFRS